MKLLPILLTARRGNWRRFKGRQTNQRFLLLKEAVLKRDHNTCRFCGFQAEKYQEVVNRDNNYAFNKPQNLATACVFCYQCFFLDAFDSNNGIGGTLIYLPEISQSDLNHFCRVLFSSMLRDAPYKGKLQTAYLSLHDRKGVIEEVFGPNSSNPSTFGQTLIDSNFSDEQLKHPILNQLRVLPDRKFFTEQTAYWKATVFNQIPL